MKTKIKHLVSSGDLNKSEYEKILKIFDTFSKKGIPSDIAKGKVIATLFFQPSTRTMSAFQSGIIRLGGGWIGVMGEKGISMEKGESFDDPIREYGCFSDLIVLRHPDDDSAERAAKVSYVPVLNGGSGSREHAVGGPWLLMIIRHFLNRPIHNLKIGIYGTPEINRAS